METTGADSALPTDPATRDLAASLLPEYSVVRILGAGGMGTVYLAREPGLRRLVAVKIISSQLAALHPLRLRFKREARAAALVSHPNVVQVYRVGTTRELGLPFIVMEYVEGRGIGISFAPQRPGRLAGCLLGRPRGARAAAPGAGAVRAPADPAVGRRSAAASGTCGHAPGPRAQGARWARIRVITATIRIRPRHRGQASGSTSTIRRSSSAQRTRAARNDQSAGSTIATGASAAS